MLNFDETDVCPNNKTQGSHSILKNKIYVLFKDHIYNSQGPTK